MNELWKAAFAVAGLASVVSFVLWSLYKTWLRLPIFQTLTKQQIYRLLILFLILTFLAFLTGVGAYLILAIKDKPGRSVDELVRLLKFREQQIVTMIDTRKKEHQDELANGVHPPGLEPNNSDTFDSVKTQFLSLSSANIEAIQNGDFVASHELVRQIRELFEGPDGGEVFSVRRWMPESRSVITPDGTKTERNWKPVYERLPAIAVYFRTITIEDLPESLRPVLHEFNEKY